MAAFRSIVCCCSNGLGSSMIMEMNMKRVLKLLGQDHIPLRHVPLTDADPHSDDLYVVGLDIAPAMKAFKYVVVIHNLVSREEFTEKVSRALNCTGKSFRIE